MRLINTKDLRIQEFSVESDIPLYAILSHTWGKGEVSLEDMKNGKAVSKPGYRKIEYTCRQALRDNLAWAWIDTCCIDKNSSSELSEAINSMFKWYERAAVCYVYLSDVTSTDRQSPEFERQFRNARWFTRSWTLQELLAPWSRDFYGADWEYLGEVNPYLPMLNPLEPDAEPRLVELIHEITRIPIECLLARNHLSDYSAATRMSWASRRFCSRTEDTAYSLMGLFGVHLSLRYGEGHKAFFRLQKKILKSRDDQTLLAWTTDPNDPDPVTVPRALAPSPKNFANSANLRTIYGESVKFSRLNKLGLFIRLPIEENRRLVHGERVFNAYLNCGRDKENLVVIKLTRPPLQICYRSRDETVNLYVRMQTKVLDFGKPKLWCGRKEKLEDLFIAHRSDNGF